MTLVTAMVTGFATSYGYNSIGPGGTISAGEKASLLRTITRLESELKETKGRLDAQSYENIIDRMARVETKIEYLDPICK